MAAEFRHREWKSGLRCLTAALLLGGIAHCAAAQKPGTALLPDAPTPAVDSGDADQNPAPQPAANGTCTITGTVLDTNDDVIPGAHVVLSDRSGATRDMQSGPNGQFAFSALRSGSYKIKVTGNGMGT